MPLTRQPDPIIRHLTMRRQLILSYNWDSALGETQARKPRGSNLSKSAQVSTVHILSMFYSFFSLSAPAVHLVSNFTVLLDSQQNIVDIWELAKMLWMNIHIDRKIGLLGRNVKSVCYPTPCTYSTYSSSYQARCIFSTENYFLYWFSLKAILNAIQTTLTKRKNVTTVATFHQLILVYPKGMGREKQQAWGKANVRDWSSVCAIIQTSNVLHLAKIARTFT